VLLLGFITLLKDEIEDLERKKSELDLLQIGLFIRFIFQKLSHDNCGINWSAVVLHTIPVQQLTFCLSLVLCTV